MKIFSTLLGIMILITGGIFFLKHFNNNIRTPLLTPSPTDSSSSFPNSASITEIIAGNLDTPWGLVLLPDNNILITERPGRVRLIENNKLLNEPVAVIKSVKEIGEGGLLGLTLHPDFSSNNYVYLYYTYEENGNNTLNRVVRMTYQNKKLTAEKIIVDKIPGASNHNGGRLKFGQDKYLYVTTGDAQQPSRAQDKNSLSGKILRVTDEGQPVPGNPFNNSIYSYGHRNPQGLAWDREGRLWSTEHGRSGLQSGLDELNLINAGKNYGWPDIEGDKEKAGMEKPVIHSSSDTWAPSGAAIVDNSIFFGGLRGSALYEYKIIDKKLIEHFKNQFGRLRDVLVDRDKMLYITTSNFDGRGIPKQNDDKLIRINPSLLP